MTSGFLPYLVLLQGPRTSVEGNELLQKLVNRFQPLQDLNFHPLQQKSETIQLSVRVGHGYSGQLLILSVVILSSHYNLAVIVDGVQHLKEVAFAKFFIHCLLIVFGKVA